jgi:hypothetical protein
MPVEGMGMPGGGGGRKDMSVVEDESDERAKTRRDCSAVCHTIEAPPEIGEPCPRSV